MSNAEGERGIRGPANDTVPVRAIRNKQTKGEWACTYRGIPGNDLAIGESQETFVNPRLVQLWEADEVARCG